MNNIYPIRVQKFLSRSGKGSRRACDRSVSEGRVAINGKIITEPGTMVEEGDIVSLDGEIATPIPLVYYIINKPQGYISVNNDIHGRNWVIDLIPGAREMGCFPVGRLDLDTTGLMIITNDGDLSNRISHPRYMVKKEYRALVKNIWNLNDLRRETEKGVEIDINEVVRDISILSADIEGDRTRVSLTIHEGRKHVVKRIFLSLDSRVYELERTAVGNMRLEGLKVGKWKEMDLEEISYKIFEEGPSSKR